MAAYIILASAINTQANTQPLKHLHWQGLPILWGHSGPNDIADCEQCSGDGDVMLLAFLQHRLRHLLIERMCGNDGVADRILSPREYMSPLYEKHLVGTKDPTKLEIRTICLLSDCSKSTRPAA
jgi:hypothetical protein